MGIEVDTTEQETAELAQGAQQTVEAATGNWEAEETTVTEADVTASADTATQPETASEPETPQVTFRDLGLNSYIIKAISEMGFEKPTPVQARIIPTLLSEEGDVVCLAQTGTGKTAAFGLPSLERIVAHNMERYTQVLVLSPTRELCKQITQDLRNYSKHLHDLQVVDVYGGAGIEPQIKALKKIPHIVVATPGRLLDLIGRKATDLSQVHTLILDEADEMLNMGFKEELDAILESLPTEKRVLLFSATLPIEVEKIAKTYMRDAQVVTVGERNSGSNNVKHYCYTIHEKDRYAALKRVVDYYPEIYGIIFCRTRRECGDITAALIKDGYDADALHGDLSQMQRDQVMRRFKEKTLKLLVATDVAARGIDVNNLTHVINYNLPDEVEQYTHRSGRTGRADKTGKSIVLINTKEQSKVRRIEKIIGKTFAQAKLPTGEEVCSKQLLSMIDQINAVEVREEEIAPYLSLIEEKWRNLGRHEIIKKFLSVEFNRFLDYYRNAQDLNIVVEKKKKKSSDGTSDSDAPAYVPRRNEKGFQWVKMNIGSKQSVSARTIVRMMTSLGVGKKGIGKIEIRRSECFVNISANAAKYVVDQTNNTDYKGRRLWSEIVE
jgi:ATP-dependent RNA helicase DeaD